MKSSSEFREAFGSLTTFQEHINKLFASATQLLQHRREIYEKDGNELVSTLGGIFKTLPEVDPDSMPTFVEAVKKDEKKLLESTEKLNEIINAVDLDSQAFDCPDAAICNGKTDARFLL